MLVTILLPLMLAASGAWAGRFVFGRRLPGRASARADSAPLVAICIVAAVIPNAIEALYRFTLTFPFSEFVQFASYFVFAFAAVGAWILSGRTSQRVLRGALVLLSLAQPLRWTWAYFSLATSRW